MRNTESEDDEMITNTGAVDLTGGRYIGLSRAPIDAVDVPLLPLLLVLPDDVCPRCGHLLNSGRAHPKTCVDSYDIAPRRRRKTQVW